LKFWKDEELEVLRSGVKGKDGGMKKLSANRFAVVLTAASTILLYFLLCDNMKFEI
jgi:hypothetical protein